MSWRSEGESEENQRPALIASRSSMVRMGSSMGCLVSDWQARPLSRAGPCGPSGLPLVRAEKLGVARLFPGQEGRDADTAIAVVQVAHEVVALAANLLVQAGGSGFVQQFLDAGQCVGRL